MRSSPEKNISKVPSDSAEAKNRSSSIGEEIVASPCQGLDAHRAQKETLSALAEKGQVHSHGGWIGKVITPHPNINHPFTFARKTARFVQFLGLA
jgi:hypothetical protein